MRRALGVATVLLVASSASCSGGGCSNGCVSPLPGGVVGGERTVSTVPMVSNAASVRLTRSGLDALAANLPVIATRALPSNTAWGEGVVTFDVPKGDVSTSVLGSSVTIHVCPDGPNPASSPPTCIAEVNVGAMKLHVDAVTPHAVKAAGTIPVRLRDLPVGGVPVLGDVHAGVGSGRCDNGAPRFDTKDFAVALEIPLIEETLPPRTGYTKVDLKNAAIEVSIHADDVAICKDCGFASFLCNGVLDVVKGLTFDSLVRGVTQQIRRALEAPFCTKPTPSQSPPCPDGSQPDSENSRCVYSADPTTCLPIALGTDGRVDLAGLLTVASPKTGAFNFALAAGGNADPAPGAPADDAPYAGHTPNGLTFAMLGGTSPQAPSACVPKFTRAPPTGIPIPDEMLRNTIAPWPASEPTGPHVGIAVAGRFLEHALGTAYASGIFCLAISTEHSRQLTSGLLSVLVPSLKKLTFERAGAPIAVTTRPQAPPSVVIGRGTDLRSDPLLLVSFPKLAIDFYVWSDDRFLRAFTLTADVGVPINVQTGKDPKTISSGELFPVLGDVSVANAAVTNSEETLTDEPALMAVSLASILQGLAGQLLGGLDPIDLSSSLASLGLSLAVPDRGVRKLTKGQDDFLAVFADVTLAPAIAPANALTQSDTTAHLAHKSVHADAMGLTTARADALPELRLSLGSSLDARPIEYSWWIDNGTRSAWSPDRDAVVRDKYLFFQGRHTLFVSSRVIGEPATEDATPAEVPFTLDVLAPRVRLTRGDDGAVLVDAWDFVATTEQLTMRWRTLRGTDVGTDNASAWSAWTHYAAHTALALDPAAGVEVEVRDTEGNVGRASAGLVRGRPDASLSASGSGCGCTMPGRAPGAQLGAPAAALSALVALIVLARRGRSRARRVVGVGAVCAVAGMSEGCACSGERTDEPRTGCGADCNEACRPAVERGLIGAYTSVARGEDGTIWVAGYNEYYAPPTGEPELYGDLVVGKYDETRRAVDWKTVDGLPLRADGTCPPADPLGWRRGETDPGDDVGRWTSIQLGADGNPMVAYYDDTHAALKFAAYDGARWAIHAVAQDPRTDAGRYVKMLLVGHSPVLAYLQMEPTREGRTRSRVIVARASSASPRSASEWTFEDALVDETGPCRPVLCAKGEVCVKDDACLPIASGCSPRECGVGEACVTLNGAATCARAVLDTSAESFPPAVGDYVALANGPSGVGIVVYDRLRGNLLGLQRGVGLWTSTILDGETGRRGRNAADTGDTGIGASLAIDARGQWHVTYVNGLTDTLNYLVAPGGQDPKVELVDDGTGTSVIGAPFPDGAHLVGDDSCVRVDDDGTVTIAYQDATAGTLRVATGKSRQNGHTWVLKTIAQPRRFAGFFPHFVPQEGAIANWFRAIDASTRETLGDVALVTP